MKGQMKVIGFEEHYGLPFIHDAALKANDPYAEVLEAMRKSGQFPEDPKTGTQPASMIWPKGGSPPWTTTVTSWRSRLY